MRLKVLLALALFAAASSAPSYAQTRTDFWAACRDLSDVDLAIAGCSAVIKLGIETPENLAFAYSNRGLARVAKGEIEGAIDDYDESAKLNPGEAMTYYNRALAYSTRGAYAPAIADFGEAVRLAPDDARPVKARGHVLFYLARFRLAALDLDRAFTLGRDDPYVALWHHLALSRDQRPRESKLREQMATLDMTRWPAPVVRLYLGELKPVEVIDAARNADPNIEREQFCEAYFYIGQAALLGGEPSSAMDLFRLTVDTGLTTFIEYKAARAEMTRLAQ